MLIRVSAHKVYEFDALQTCGQAAGLARAGRSAIKDPGSATSRGRFRPPQEPRSINALARAETVCDGHSQGLL